MRRAVRSRSLLLALLVTAAVPATAQLPAWDDGYHVAGTPSVVRAAVGHDDGSGPAVYFGGEFTYVGSIPAAHVARWNGVDWSAVGAGTDGQVLVLATFDDGGGSDLYAAGTFATAGGVAASGIARWDGSVWSMLAGGCGLGTSLVVHDEGTGPALYVGGTFASVDGGAVPASNVARWDGTAWSALGAGLPAGVNELTVHDDGTGARLHAAAADSVWRWEGSSWTLLGVSSGLVHAMGSFDDGTGPALYVAGTFTQMEGVPASRVARWDGSAWSQPGAGLGEVEPGLGASALEMRVLDDGGGPALYVSGYLDGGRMGLLRWDGSAWTPLDAPPGPFQGSGGKALVAYDVGAGPQLFVGGKFPRAGGAVVGSLAVRTGTSWSALGPGLGANGVEFLSTTTRVDALEVIDLGDGPRLHAGGLFDGIGGTAARHVARWDGVSSSWTALGAYPGDLVEAIAAFDDGGGDGGGTVLHVGAHRWDGASWSALPDLAGTVRALRVFDDGNGPRLFVGGAFTLFGTTDATIASWDGSAWSLVGAGLGSTPAEQVLDLAVFDDGGGPALYAGGGFTMAGATAVDHVARWDGTSWSAVGGGTDGAVRALAVFDGGGGPRLIAGGAFDVAGGVTVHHLASWDGVSWSSVGGGTDGTVRALGVGDVGDGARLYVGGVFGAVGPGNLPAARIASWDGATWSALGAGADAQVDAIRAFETFEGPGVFVGGQFATLDGLPSHRIGRWAVQTCDGDPVTYCVGEPSSIGCVSSIDTTGAPSATSTNPFTLIARDVIPGEAGFLVYGFQKSNLAFHGGRLCVKTPFQRWLPPKPAKSTGSPPCTGVLTRNFNARIQSGADAQLTTGQTVYAQWYLRDPADPGGNLENLTNAVRFVICH